MSKPLKITDVVLRDGHQSLLATRMRIEDMLPIAEKLDQVGYWSLETWGGATFDACIRFLGEDPWERLRLLKKAMPNTPQQMLLRGQNLLGYRHYADDVVTAFVEKAAENGMDVFRIFDAMNDIRNLETAIKATVNTGKHAQGTISYTISPLHTLDMWVDMGKRLEDLGSHSIAIKDMAGLLKPYVAEELVGKLKQSCSIPIALHCHATTGLSTSTIVKAVEAGIDMVDSSISSMSLTYGHSPTESVVAIFEGTEYDTGMDLVLLEEIAAYFREVRKKYAKFEGSLKGVDARILLAQVPGGMLTNLENQLKEQNALDKFDVVLEEIPKVREDLGFIPLVTPTSQIVGTQAVINVLSGERYKTITKESAGILKGEYGAAIAPMNAELQARVLEGAEPITCRPADLIDDEMEALIIELKTLADEKGLTLSDRLLEDALIYAQFPQVGLKFIENRGNPDAFEPTPLATGQAPVIDVEGSPAEHYEVSVNGQAYNVLVSPGSGEISQIIPAGGIASAAEEETPEAAPLKGGSALHAPLAGNIFKVLVKPGQQVVNEEIVIIMEAMKMETEIRCMNGGTVTEVMVLEGEAVTADQPLLRIA